MGNRAIIKGKNQELGMSRVKLAEKPGVPMRTIDD